MLDVPLLFWKKSNQSKKKSKTSGILILKKNNKFGFGEIIVRNIINLFVKIKSFETVTLHTSGMRHVTDYEIVNRGDEAEISQYAVG